MQPSTGQTVSWLTARVRILTRFIIAACINDEDAGKINAFGGSRSKVYIRTVRTSMNRYDRKACDKHS